jgi:hypothetical protein
MSKIFVGIDIGKNGGIAVLKNNTIELSKIPLINKEIDIKALSDFLKETGKEPSHFIFEKLGVIFGTSKSTAFSMGYQLGIIEGICISQNLSYTKVRAVDWQKEIFQGISEIKKTNGKRDTKGMALIAGSRLFPDISFKKSQRSSKPDDGLIDALLMAEYARRKNL